MDQGQEPRASRLRARDAHRFEQTRRFEITVTSGRSPQYKVFTIRNVIRQIKRYSIVKLVVSADSGINHPVSNMCRARLWFCRPGNRVAQRRSDAPWYALSIVRTCYFAPNICSWRPTEPRFIEADRASSDLGKPQHLQCRVPVIARGVGLSRMPVGSG
jgi:hypothetical protein